MLIRRMALVTLLLASSLASAQIVDNGDGTYNVNCANGPDATINVTLAIGAGASITHTNCNRQSQVGGAMLDITFGNPLTISTTASSVSAVFSQNNAAPYGNTFTFAFTRTAPPAPVPTLSEWAMITFAMLIAGFGIYQQRRRQS